MDRKCHDAVAPKAHRYECRLIETENGAGSQCKTGRRVGDRRQGQRDLTPSPSAGFAGHSKKNDTPLLGGIESLLKASAASARIRQHVLSQLLCLGRHTVTGVLGTAGRLFCDWTADCRMYSAQPRLEPQALFAPVRQALLPPISYLPQSGNGRRISGPPHSH